LPFPKIKKPFFSLNKTTIMKSIHSFMAAATAVIFLVSCKKNTNDAASEQQQTAKNMSSQQKGIAGYVYTLSNQTSGNSVLVYARSAGGTLSYSTSYSTGGAGTGAGLGSQGAVVLSGDLLLAVNAGSNSISSFAVTGGMLQWKSTIASGGVTPKSITVYDHLVYVLNAGGTGNVSGFTLDAEGILHPLANSTRPLSSTAADPAQVSFISDGSAIAITEKATNKITTYTINEQGLPGTMHTLPSANATPFGFAVGKDGLLFVSEAAGGAPGASTVSSYMVNSNGVISLIDGPVSAGQTAACWVVVTNNGKYVYDSNTGSGTITSFTSKAGDLDVLEAAAGVTGMGSSPSDADLTNNSQFLYVRNGNRTISAFSVDNDGGLDAIQTVTGLPASAVGLAAK
jgi:6-phosphogluconolactonase